eukprot:6453905-Amphidinium_carterae.1
MHYHGMCRMDADNDGLLTREEFRRGVAMEATNEDEKLQRRSGKQRAQFTFSPVLQSRIPKT